MELPPADRRFQRHDTTVNSDAEPVRSRDTSPRQAATVSDFVCPVCAARQPLSTACRRCQADLTLLTDVYAALVAKRKQCWVLVRQRRLWKATQLAQECLSVSGDTTDRRMLATCYLLQGDIAAALRLGRPCSDIHVPAPPASV